MPPSNLQGLNIVHPPAPAGDARDLIGHPYHDLTAQLDLWTNLAFDSDEGPVAKTDDDLGRKSADDDDDISSPTLVDVDRPRQQSIDINNLLAGFGIDPFAVPQQPSSPTLAQLLALHTAHFAQPPTGSAAPVQQHKAKSTEKPAQTSVADEVSPPAKRARNRRTSETLAAASPGPVTGEQTALLAAEDKRRRNTAASARFRLKKKEREAALEGKAKELETRVNELERECETLRRENGWLKGLVIGVTGVASAPQFTSTTTTKRRREEAEEI
ncbi:hypothetical protein APHAL10511_003633 [Amanita phalloides]|nr:hypothetical protein APHAL10511_003633 [Amanita phalloides]